MTGIIFDIQRGSYVNGPGIRTTVFFKGCNLKCSWCHNPESRDFNPQIMFYKSKCTSCGICKQFCESKESCILCGRCTRVCPNGAKAMCGKEYTSDEIMEIIKKDIPYYENSNGGVTFSGGECMLQVDFLTELLQKCKEHNIHTAVDTAGYIPYSHFEQILPYTDLFIYDVKSMNNTVHKKYTGVSNSLILDNLKSLLATDKDIWVRVPIISGINDSEEEINELKGFYEMYGYPKKTELLPYHSLGEHKYEAINLELIRFRTPTNDKMQKLNYLIK
ncbi:MAG: glycyl-radical enzyme activating protein [Clostridia bacterium]|nr:glycyl-radical enzyme activating protein [Clostridia bacterium]